MFWKVSEVGSDTKMRLGVRHGWKCGYSFQQGNVLTSRLSSALGLVSKGHRCEHKPSLSCPHVRDNLFLCHVVLSWSPIRPLPCPCGFQLMLSWLCIFFAQQRWLFPSMVLWCMFCLYHSPIWVWALKQSGSLWSVWTIHSTFTEVLLKPDSGIHCCCR